jgi:hypothetical protein
MSDDTLAINYDLRNRNGQEIWIPANPRASQIALSALDVYGTSETKKFPIGTIAWKDQRKFAYSYAGGTILGNSRLLVDANYIPSASGYEDTNGFEGYINAAYAAGTKDIVIEDTTDRVVDYYQGGLFTIFNADGVKSCSIRINSSDVATSADVVTLHLDDGLPWAVVEHDFCDAYRSPYSNVTQPASTHYETFMGVAHMAVTSAYYFWLQIAGPAWLAQYAAASVPGYTADYRDAFAWFDGTVKVGATAGALQRVGYGMGKTVSGYGDTYVMMQLG